MCNNIAQPDRSQIIWRMRMTCWIPKATNTLLESSSSSSVICQTTSPKPLPKRFLHTVRSRASSFNWQYPLLILRSSSSFLRLLPRLLVTCICPFIFPSITCCRRQFLRKMWPICNTYCFSTATMVARKLLIITLYLLCLSCVKNFIWFKRHTCFVFYLMGFIRNELSVLI